MEEVDKREEMEGGLQTARTTKHKIMKFWRLVSLLREAKDKQMLEAVLLLPKWSEWWQHYKNHDELVRSQNRKILDMELPDKLCREVLAKCEWKYVREKNDLIRIPAHKAAKWPVVLSTVEVYEQYGGDCLEDIAEFGVYHIQRTERQWSAEAEQD